MVNEQAIAGLINPPIVLRFVERFISAIFHFRLFIHDITNCRKSPAIKSRLCDSTFGFAAAADACDAGQPLNAVRAEKLDRKC